MADDKEKLKFIVGVSSGIYMAARSPELSSVVRKLGFALTRGANAIELAADVPHEIDYTQGKEVRYIAEKQDLTLLLHGSLTVPMCMPERGEWRDAQNHIQKSVRSAVMGGCKYVNFHACLHYWLEMMTYAGRKLTMAFCDHEGKFIDRLLEKNPKLRKWFIDKKADFYGGYGREILSEEEITEAYSIAGRIISDWRRNKIVDILKDAGFLDDAINLYLQTGRIPLGTPEQLQQVNQRIDDLSVDYAKKEADERKKGIQRKIEEKLTDETKKWNTEELRGGGGVLDGYHIMAHHLYYNNDPVWKTMYNMYKDVIDKYKTVKYSKDGQDYSYSLGGNPNVDIDYWVDAAWEKAESDNDRNFKEFYYAVCAAKYIEGHISEALKWMDDKGPDGLLGSIEAEVKDKDDLKKLEKIAKDLKITLEIPDARSPEYAGLYLIYRPKQIYAAVKTISKELDTKKLAMLIDFEHIATQGFDPLNEIKEFVKLAPDAGKYILSLHVTKPTPLHHHIQVEIGDIEIYKLLWELADKAELGKHHDTYLIYERGGERDPFKQSVTAIRLMVDQLQKNTKPEELVAKPEFFGVAGPALGSEERQRVVIREHARDPIEGLLVVPEEKYTALGKAATEKAGAEKWKKEELS